MVFAQPYVCSRMMNRTSLADDNVTGFGNFATEKLNT